MIYTIDPCGMVLIMFWSFNCIVIFLSALNCLALGLLSLPLGGCAVGVGLIFAALLSAEAYAPELGGLFFIRAMLGFALIETFVIVVVVLVALVFVM